MPGFSVPAVRRYLPTLLMLVGVLLLAYVALQYAAMHLEQRRLAQEWERQNQAVLPPDRQGDAKMLPAKTDSGKPGAIRLQVPSISLDSMVVEGTSNKALSLGPGRMTSTAIPGEQGNAVITAHRDTFFRHIQELNKGDEILVQRNGRTFRFGVTRKQIVEPTDVWVLNPTQDSQLTLITCYPTYYIGPAPQRLVVFSRLLDSKLSDSKLPE